MVEPLISSCIPSFFGLGIIISFIFLLHANSKEQQKTIAMHNLFKLISDYYPTPSHSTSRINQVVKKQPKPKAKKVRTSIIKTQQISSNIKSVDVSFPNNSDEIPRTNIVFRCERCGAMLIKGTNCMYCERISDNKGVKQG